VLYMMGRELLFLHICGGGGGGGGGCRRLELGVPSGNNGQRSCAFE
jgi:hypothetical protein